MVSDDLLRACSSSDNGTQNGKKKRFIMFPISQSNTRIKKNSCDNDIIKILKNLF